MRESGLSSAAVFWRRRRSQSRKNTAGRIRGRGQAAKDRLSALRCPTACRVCGVLLMAQPCPKLSPLYQPRDPKASDLWRVIDEHFDAFQQVYDERFQAMYGYWRPIVQQSVAAFLKCGELQEGFARVRCPDCYHEMFVAFSCKQPTIAARRCPPAHPVTRSGRC